MRRIMLASTVLLAFAVPAFAQGQMGQQGSQGGYGQGQMSGGPGGDQHGFDGGWHRHDWSHGPWKMMHGREMEMFGRLLHELASGTFYRFRRGDNEVDVHCPPNQQLQACVAGATELMHALQQAPAQGSSSGGKAG